MKPYSKLPIRDRIERDLQAVERDLEYWKDSGDTDHLQALADKKERLIQQADHYDREESAGYESPATKRWGAINTDLNGSLGETLDLDDED